MENDVLGYGIAPVGILNNKKPRQFPDGVFAI